MSDCCADTSCEIEKLVERQQFTLKAVLVINIGMFITEIAAGILAGSTALLADSLDMLGDTLVYSFSLFAVRRNAIWKATSAMLKGSIMALFGLFVLAQAVYKLLQPEVPVYHIIEIVGLLALIANMLCLGLLWRHRAEDINMRSVWLCSRNDIINNISVIIAGIGVWLTTTQWPDVLVGIGISILFLYSAYQVIREAFSAYTAYKT